MAIFVQRGRGVELGTTKNQLLVAVGFEAGTSRFQIQCPKPFGHAASLPASRTDVVKNRIQKKTDQDQPTLHHCSSNSVARVAMVNMKLCKKPELVSVFLSEPETSRCLKASPRHSDSMTLKLHLYNIEISTLRLS